MGVISSSPSYHTVFHLNYFKGSRTNYATKRLRKLNKEMLMYTVYNTLINFSLQSKQKAKNPKRKGFVSVYVIDHSLLKEKN